MAQRRKATRNAAGGELSEMQVEAEFIRIRDAPQRIKRAATLRAIKRYYEADEFEVTSKKASLICPISKARVKIPVRSVNCRHMECFDLRSYLDYHRPLAFWECPFSCCKAQARCDSLRVDELVTGTGQDYPSCPAQDRIQDPVLTLSCSLTVTDRRVMHYIAACCVPFQSANHHTFRVLISSSDKKMKLKDESHYRNSVLPVVYQYAKDAIQQALDGCPVLSFTLDVWSGPTASFLGVTAVGISEKWAREKFLLTVREFPGEHTGERLLALLEEILDEWHLDPDRCHAFIHDQGSNMLKAFRGSALEDGDCSTHMIHTVVMNSFFPKENGKVKETVVTKLVGRGRALVGHFRHSNLAYERLRALQKRLDLPPRRLVQDVCTRWSSTHDMLARLIEQKAALDAYCIQFKQDLLLSDADWNTASEIIKLLRPCAQYTTVLCRDSSPVSMQVAVGKTLLDLLDQYNGTLTEQRDLMKAYVREKFGELHLYRTHGLAHYLDARFKDRVVDNPASFRLQARDWIINEIQRNGVEGPDQIQVLREVQPPQPSGERSFLSSLGAKYAKTNAGPSHSQPSHRHDLDHEINAYLLEECEDWETDPLKWWKVNEALYPTLAKIARRYLTAPATSADSERVFSTCKWVFERRSNLSPKKAEQLVFLHKNLPTINYRY